MNKRVATRRRRNAMLMAEALDIAKTYDIPVSKGNNVVNVLQTVLDRAMDLWRFVCMEVDKLDKTEWMVSRVDAEGNTLVEPNVWIQYEGNLRAELMDLALRMGHLGIDDRKVRVQEAQVELLGRAVRDACHDIDLPPDIQRQLGAALRVRLEAIEAGLPNPATNGSGPNDKQPVIEGNTA